MSKLYLLGKVCLFMSFLCLIQNAKAISYTWNGSVSSEFGVAANWSPAGIPGIADDIIINSSGFSPQFEELPGVRNFTINSGVFNIQNFIFLVRGTAQFNGGTVNTGTIQFVNAGAVTFGNATISVTLTGSAASFAFNGATFNNPVTVNRTGGTSITCVGGNTFNQSFALTNSGGQIIMSNLTGDVYNGSATFTSNSSNALFISHGNNTTSLFNGNLAINTLVNNGSVQIGINGGVSEIASGFRVQNGTLGINFGTVNIRNLRQFGNSVNQITASNPVTINIQNSIFDGNVMLQSGNSTSNTCQYNGSLTINKTSNSGNTWNGGNTFNGEFTLNHNGTGGTITLGNINPDVFNTTARFNVLGNGIIDVARASTNNIFRGNILLRSSATSTNTGIRFCQGSGSALLQDNATISLAPEGYSNGVIRLRRLTQLNSLAINLSQLTGSAQLFFESNNSFLGNVTVAFPRLFLNGSIFNGQNSFAKQGGSNDFSTGGNTFNGLTSFSNNSNSSIYLANVTADVFNADVRFLDGNGSGIIFPAHTASGNQFNGDIILGSASAGGVRFGQNGGSSILSNGSVIEIEAGGFNFGDLRLRNFTQIGNTLPIVCNSLIGNAIFRIENNCIFNTNLTINFPQIFISNSTFNGIVNLNKGGANENVSAGGNVFNNTLRIASTGSNLIFGGTQADIFNGDVFINSGASGNIGMARSSLNNQFNGDIYLSSNTGGGIQFCQSNGTAILATGKRILNGPEGITAGNIVFRNFSQIGNENLQLNGTGNAQFSVQANCTFNGNLTVSFSNISCASSIFNGNVSFTKTSNTNNTSIGGNTFNQTFELTNTGADITFGDVLPDIFNGDAYFINNGTGLISIARTGLNNQFNGDLYLSSTSPGGIQFCQNNGSARLASGKRLLSAIGGISAGDIIFRNFTQQGSTSQALNGTSNSELIIQAGCLFGGNTDFTFPNLTVTGSTFQGVSRFEKTGNTSDNYSNGGNTFNGQFIVRNTGSRFFCFGNSSADVYNGVVRIENTSTGTIEMARTSANNIFNQNIEINATGAGNVIFGGNNGSSTLNNSSIISFFNNQCQASTVRLRNIVKSGTASISLINNAAVSSLLDLVNCEISGNAIFTVPRITLANNTFNGTVQITKTRDGMDNSPGNNTFNGALTLINNSPNSLVFSNTTRDIYQGSITLSASGVGGIYLAQSGSNTSFNGNIIVQTFSSSSTGLFWGQNGGTSQLADGRTIAISGGTFSGSVLRIRNFTQVGNQALTLNNFGGSASLYFESDCIFNGAISVNVPNIYLNGSRFNGNLSIVKTGNVNNDSNGNNLFNGNVTITNATPGYIRLASISGGGPDNFFGNITIASSVNNNVDIASRFNSIFNGNISIAGTTSDLTFGLNGGIAELGGNSIQSISATATRAILFNRLRINKSGGRVNLSNQIRIGNALTLTSGIIYSSNLNLLVINNAATVTGTSNASFVDGPVRKIGNQAFTFPVGKNNNYRPIAISAPSTNTHHFTAEYFLQTPGNFYNANSKDASIDHISSNEFWILDRTNGTSAVTVTLSWFELVSGQVTNLSKLRVCRWDGAVWRNHGNGVFNGNTVAGNISSAGPISSFSPFTLGSIDQENPLPIELIYFNAALSGNDAMLEWATASEINNHYFELEKSYDLIDFETIAQVSGAGNSNQIIKYNHLDTDLKSGITYYRLKQVDFDGKVSYEGIQSVQYQNDDLISWNVYPNPTIDWINISGEQINNENGLIQVFDTKGALVLQESKPASFGVYQINLSNLPEGVYYLTLKTQNQTSHKVIKKIN